MTVTLNEKITIVTKVSDLLADERAVSKELEDLDKLFSSRFSDKDEEFMKCNELISPPPPCLPHWGLKLQRNHPWQRNNERNISRGRGHYDHHNPPYHRDNRSQYSRHDDNRGDYSGRQKDYDNRHRSDYDSRQHGHYSNREQGHHSNRHHRTEEHGNYSRTNDISALKSQDYQRDDGQMSHQHHRFKYDNKRKYGDRYEPY